MIGMKMMLTTRFRTTAPWKKRILPQQGWKKAQAWRKWTSGFGLFWLRLVVNGDQAQDFQLALAVRRDDYGFVPDFLVEQRAADGRGGGNLAGGHVGLFAGHQLVFHLFILGVVENLDCGTETNLVLGD